jgi:hypothetical protein
MRNLITPDDVLRAKPAAVRVDALDLAEICEAAMTAIESSAGRRFFAGKRRAPVLPTGGRFAKIADPPITSIVSVNFVSGSTSELLDLDGFGIEDSKAGIVWNSAGWSVRDSVGSPRSELDRHQAQGFPGGYADEAEPHHWLVVYTSGSPPPAIARRLAFELTSLWIDRQNRGGVTAETFNRVSRSFNFKEAEDEIRARARRIGGRVLLR